jgi:hypothetical protein
MKNKNCITLGEYFAWQRKVKSRRAETVASPALIRLNRTTAQISTPPDTSGEQLLTGFAQTA